MIVYNCLFHTSDQVAENVACNTTFLASTVINDRMKKFDVVFANSVQR